MDDYFRSKELRLRSSPNYIQVYYFFVLLEFFRLLDLQIFLYVALIFSSFVLQCTVLIGLVRWCVVKQDFPDLMSQAFWLINLITFWNSEPGHFLYFLILNKLLL